MFRGYIVLFTIKKGVTDVQRRTGHQALNQKGSGRLFSFLSIAFKKMFVVIKACCVRKTALLCFRTPDNLFLKICITPLLMVKNAA
ncbi:Uncharacterized protein dnm_028910 [Desulfonema magnum]|uniref:Uncharacterized protein n=1 Tax=Desulfonema magnum TaxID=45655 RepID=A0A975BK01_9BACT|nr:Uncharacterized protein dnm_028910 [Desulfonema magnum]